MKISGMVIIGLAVAAGIVRTWLESSEWAELPYRPLEAYVAAHRQAGQVYLIPVKLYDYRLEAGVPIYADFLSIPYRDADVIEWYGRYRDANYFYQGADCTMLADFSGQGVTHVVLPVTFQVTCPQLVGIYADGYYRLYTLTP